MLNSFDEWTSLKEVIVGSCSNYQYHHIDDSFVLFFFENIYPMLSATERGSAKRKNDRANKYIEISKRILSELNEDLEGLVRALTAAGVRVTRPAELPLESAAGIATPFWSSRATPALNIRDNAIVLGNTLVETAPHVRARLFENDLLKPAFYRYFFTGAKWISMPRPALSRGTLDDEYYRNKRFKVEAFRPKDDAIAISGLGFEMVFDGAQCIRFGRDVIVNVSNENHRLGYQWLQRTLGDQFRFHLINQMADNHIDSMIMPLRPGLLLLRAPALIEYLPAPLRNWDVVIPPEPSSSVFNEYEETMPLASKYIDMNVLSIDEETVVVNSLCPEFIRQLEGLGMTVIPVRHRHRRLFSGGFHCFTLDCVRVGGLETYL